LLSVVITAIFQIKENNIFFLQKFNNSSKNNEHISLATVSPISYNKLRNENIYLDKIVDFKDDDIRKELKNTKVSIKDKELKELDFSTDEFSLKIKKYISSYKIEDKIQKDIYTFKMEY
jgi:hypothetical protein